MAFSSAQLAALPPLCAALAAATWGLTGSCLPALLFLLPLALLDAGLARKGPKPGFQVRKAEAADVPSLRRLYLQDYVQCHRRLLGRWWQKEDWEEILGQVDFEGLVPTTGKLRLLTCMAGDELVGYVLYELREKAKDQRRQRYCELVNIVVQSRWQHCGAGRHLFEAMYEDLQKTAPVSAGDLRLFVAERNAGPLAWYERLGFRRAGKQVEKINGREISFLRMRLLSR